VSSANNGVELQCALEWAFMPLKIRAYGVSRQLDARADDAHRRLSQSTNNS